MARLGKTGSRFGWGILAAALLVILVILAIVAGMDRAPTLPVVLSDGTKVRVGAVQTGSILVSPYDPMLSRLVVRLPATVRRWLQPVLPAANPVWTGVGPALGMWMEWDRIPGVARTNAFPSSASFLVLLNDGRPFLLGSYQEVTARLDDGRYVEGFFFPAPPPSIPEVTIHLYSRRDGDGSDPHPSTALAQWTVRPSPVRSVPPWTVPPLPQTQSSGALDVTLRTLVMNADPSAGGGSWKGASNAESAWTYAQFELTENGRPAAAWQVERIHSLTDPHGGVSGTSVTWVNGTNDIRWRWPLWPGQPWKLGVEFTRTSNFESNALVTFTGLVPGQTVSGRMTAAAGTIFAKKFVPAHWDPRQRQFELEFGYQVAQSPGRLTVVSVTDSRGSNVVASRQSWSETDTTFRLESTSASNAPFTATLALQIGRIVEFIAEPEVVGKPAR